PRRADRAPGRGRAGECPSSRLGLTGCSCSLLVVGRFCKPSRVFRDGLQNRPTWALLPFRAMSIELRLLFFPLAEGVAAPVGVHAEDVVRGVGAEGAAADRQRAAA